MINYKWGIVMKNILFCCLLFVVPSMLFAQSEAEIKQQYQAKLEAYKKAPGFGMNGTVERGRTARYSMNGNDFEVNKKTRINGNLKVGSVGRVQGFRKDGKFIATSVFVGSKASARSLKDPPEESIWDREEGDVPEERPEP